MKTEIVQIIFDDATEKLSADIIETIQSATIKFLHFSKVTERFVTLLFCGEEKIKELNRVYREKDRSTDILSWSYDEEVVGSQIQMIPWGELAICLKICQIQAIDAGWDLKTELLRLIAHGITHLRGYDHKTEEEEKEMLQLELELLSLVGLEELYP